MSSEQSFLYSVEQFQERLLSTVRKQDRILMNREHAIRPWLDSQPHIFPPFPDMV